MRTLLLFVLLLFCVQAQAAITVVQQATCAVTAGTFVHACTATLAGNVTSGNSVIVIFGGNNVVTAVSGGGVASYSAAISNRPGVFASDIWFGHGSDGSSAAIAVTAAAATRLHVVVLEVSGLANAAAEATGTNGETTGTLAVLPSGNIVTTTADSIIVVGFAWNRAASTPSYSSGPSNSFTRTSVPTVATTTAGEGAYRIVSSASTYSTSLTLDGTPSEWTAAGASFKIASSGPTPAQRSAGFFMQTR